MVLVRANELGVRSFYKDFIGARWAAPSSPSEEFQSRRIPDLHNIWVGTGHALATPNDTAASKSRIVPAWRQQEAFRIPAYTHYRGTFRQVYAASPGTLPHRPLWRQPLKQSDLRFRHLRSASFVDLQAPSGPKGPPRGIRADTAALLPSTWNGY